MNRSDTQIDKLVLVIHGVGDPKPGQTIDLFARSLADEQRPLDERQETLWLPEKSADPNYVKTFPSAVRTLDSGSSQIKLAEVFWGDLSRVWQGLLGTILGLAQVLFGLRYIAYVAADQKCFFANWLKQLGLFSSRILHGPVMAVSFFLAILAFAASGTQLLWTDSYKSVLWTQIVLAGCCAFGLMTSSIGGSVGKSQILKRFWFWVSIVVVFVSGLMTIKSGWLDQTFPDMIQHHGVRPGLIWYCRVLVVLLGLLWFTEIMVMTGMGICWLGALVRSKSHRPALHIALLLPALAIGVWGQLLPMMWLAVQIAVKKFFQLPEFNDLFKEVIPLLGIQLNMVIVMLLAGAFIGVRYIRWRAKHDITEFIAGSRSPRLIVHGLIQSILAFCMLAGVMLIFGLGMLEFISLISNQKIENTWLHSMAESGKYSTVVLVPASVLLFLLLPRLRPVFDIALDIVNHFYFRATDVQDAVFNEDEIDISETTFQQGTMFFARRDAIHSRVKQILNHHGQQFNNRPELILVSHSQGTMIAIEVLNDPEMAWLKNRFSSVSLVTMGSPLTNLYQHYFAHLYPALDQPFWSSFRKQVDRWVNIFRIDDPVGTEIHFPKSRVSYSETQQAQQSGYCEEHTAQLSQPTSYSNHPVGCRGHVSYWNDREVLNIIRSELFGVSSTNLQNQQRAA